VADRSVAESKANIELHADAAPIGLQIQARLANNAANYNRWIYEQIAPYIGQRILDIGCAIGNITQFYLDRDRIIGLDVVDESLEVIRARFADYPNFEAHHVDITTPELQRFASENIDTVVMLNVLEHIEDDIGTLRGIWNVLVPGGRLLMLVPVIKALYGPMDKADHHYRRYSRAELNYKLRAANFEIEQQKYFNFLGIAAWFFTNHILRRTMAAPTQYSLFDKLVPILSRLEAIKPPPLGLSLVTICRKPQ
jgi:2-polyprenyl-3-methyl-5-hydroxy-6-metoxy-1,4-benzoquinol methylase